MGKRWIGPDCGTRGSNMGAAARGRKARRPQKFTAIVANIRAGFMRITVSYGKSKKTGPAPAMNASPEMDFEEMLRVKLEVLRREHRDLDEAVHVLATAGRPDPLTLRRLKKQKLLLKDQIVQIEDRLIPNIIA
jgi:hypothetical protein